jgi:hypothetical protein
MVAQRPDLAGWIDVGDSWDKINGLGGYDLRVLRLTNSSVAGPKPKLFVTSSIHAREYAPAGLMTRFAEDLFESYDVDPDTTWILDHHEVQLMLLANPDGRKKAELGLSWRKNTNQDYCSPTSNLRGADLNRNFEFQWGCCGGASNQECNELYRGPFAASEPEVQTIQNYLLAEFPDQRDAPLGAPAPDDATGIYMDIHASGKLVIWPWGFPGTAPNGVALQTFGRKLAFFNGYQPKQAAQLYPTDGSTVDFGYGELGLASMAYELGTSFFQGCTYFENTILPANLPSLVYAAKVARTPYLTPAGPDVLQVTATPPNLFEGSPFELTAVIDDTRYNNQNGTEPTQNVTAAEYYIDVPPWDDAAPAGAGMFAADGSFDSSNEAVRASVATTGLTHGRHTVFVRGRDGDGNWGAFSAVFVGVSDEQGDDDGDGVSNGADCAPGDGTLWSAPSAAEELTVTKDTLGNISWLPPLQPGASIVTYELLRADTADDLDSATCLPTLGSLTVATDGELPRSGGVFHYLVRATNACGDNLGQTSSGQPRSGIDCTP